MTKEKKTLLIIGVIIVFGIGIFIGYQKQSKVQPTVKVQELVEKVCNLEEITRIEYQMNDVIRLENQDGTWVNNELTNLQYNLELMQNWITKIQTLETKEVLKNVEDSSIYGINDESIVITLYDSANNTQTIKLGDIIESEDSMYIQSGLEDILYVVSYDAAKDILVRPNDFVECTEILKIPELQSVRLDYKNKTMYMKKENVWSLKEYYAMPAVLKEQEIEEIINTIENIKIEHYVGTYEELGEYGLDSPRLTLTLNDETKIAFGSQSGECIYVSVNDGQDVYTVDKAVYATFASFEPFDAIEKQVIHLDMNDVKEVNLINPQGEYVLTFNHDVNQENQNVLVDSKEQEAEGVTQAVEDDKEGQSAESTESKEEQSTESTESKEDGIEVENKEQPEKEGLIVATLNQKGLKDVEAEEWLSKIKASLWIEALLQNPSIEQKEDRKAEATICFTLKDDTEILVELVPYDINYYILRYNGTIEFAVNKDKVTKLFNEVTQFVKK